MATFILTLLFLLIVVAAMAVGSIFANKPIKGSCGGIQQLGLGGKCEICGDDPNKCEEEKEKSSSASSGQFYDAAK